MAIFGVLSCISMFQQPPHPLGFSIVICVYLFLSNEAIIRHQISQNHCFEMKYKTSAMLCCRSTVSTV